MIEVSTSNQSGSESTSRPSMSNSTRLQRLLAWASGEKYFASGWMVISASVDCSGTSWNSSDSATPIRSGRSSRITLARSSRSGQAG